MCAPDSLAPPPTLAMWRKNDLEQAVAVASEPCIRISSPTIPRYHVVLPIYLSGGELVDVRRMQATYRAGKAAIAMDRHPEPGDRGTAEGGQHAIRRQSCPWSCY